MSILVKIDAQAGQRGGDWVVTSGSRVLSRHRKKSAAVSKGRTEARKRGTDLRIQNTNGQWRQETGAF